jgi:hypothetical protein
MFIISVWITHVYKYPINIFIKQYNTYYASSPVSRDGGYGNELLSGQWNDFVSDSLRTEGIYIWQCQ